MGNIRFYDAVVGKRKDNDMVDPSEGTEKHLYFVFTPRLCLFYEYTIKEGLGSKHKEGSMDYAKAIFGYVKGEDSYRSKVSFTDAVVKGTDCPDSLVYGEKQAILPEPKPTSHMDYVKPDEKGMPVT